MGKEKMKGNVSITFIKITPRRAGLSLALLLLADLLYFGLRFPALTEDRNLLLADLDRSTNAALVLGASVRAGQTPSGVLQHRLETAISLYNEGKVGWFLVSGDNRSPFYNEPRVMRKYLLEKGVPHYHIVSDYAGRRTHDSIRRAQMVFKLKNVVLVTSDFHMPRSLFIAQNLGLDAIGVSAPTESFPILTRVNFYVREWLACHKAMLDYWFPPDTLLGPLERTPLHEPMEDADF